LIRSIVLPDPIERKKEEAALARALAERQSTSVLKRLLLVFVRLESLDRKYAPD
jgi:hypothetical protein